MSEREGSVPENQQELRESNPEMDVEKMKAQITKTLERLTIVSNTLQREIHNPLSQDLIWEIRLSIDDLKSLQSELEK